MCGIVAIFSGAAPVCSGSLSRAVRELAHRGPDGQGRWLAPHGRVGLGHTRLSIIDLETGAQPIANEDGKLRVVVNGEFYGFEAVRRDLEARGHHFRTRSDSEIAVHLYEEFGEAFLGHLRGEFAFVLWDEARGRLFAARDRFGIKPLFYARHGGALVLASEVKALLAAGVPAAWDEESVFRQLFLCVPEDRSLFRDVRQVPPGHYLVATADSVRVSSYWDADYPRGDAGGSRLTRQECVSRVRDLLGEAVRLRMRADVPVGFLLSGGLDSSSVLGMAAARAGGPAAAFTIAFGHADYDESAEARQTAEQLGADFRPVPVSEADVADHFAASVWSGEMVQYNAHGTARYLLSRAVRRAGYRVVLAGEGADELFAGYGFCQAARLSGAPGRFLPRWLRLLFRLCRPANPTERLVGRTSPWLARLVRVLDFPREMVAYLAEALAGLRSVLAADFLARFAGRDPYREFYQGISAGGKLRGRHPVKQILYLWLKSIFVNYILAADRLDMSHGVEVRLPFLDHRLFEYTRNIPAALLAAGTREKAILREAARPFIPARVYGRPKRPFLAPPSTLSPGNKLYHFLQDVLRGPMTKAVPFLDRAAVLTLLDRLPSLDDKARAAFDPLLMMMASLCVLQDRYRL